MSRWGKRRHQGEPTCDRERSIPWPAGTALRRAEKNWMMLNTMTVDVEDWYHCLDGNPGNWDRCEDRIDASLCRLLDVFRRTESTATFFVLGHVAQRHPDLIGAIREHGHEIASHGYLHQFIYRQPQEQFRDDVARSLDLLDELAGEPVRGYRAPFFSITKSSLWALPILGELGIHYDSSIHLVLNHRYGIQDAPRLPYEPHSGLTEVPISTFPVGPLNVPCGGCVYFRVYPYRMIRRIFRRLNRRDERVVFYLHPWEIDPDHPRLPLSPGLKLRHYWALDKTEKKLERLCTDFRFASVNRVLDV